MRRRIHGGRGGLWGVVLSATVLIGSCQPTAPRRTSAVGDDAITVASFNFAESVILAEIYAQALEGGGLKVDRQLDLGTRELVEPALERGLVEFVPEYSGSALTFVTKGEAAPTADEGATYRDLRSALEGRGIIALAPAPAQDKNGIVARAETAMRFGLTTISDLVPAASQLVFGGPPECPERPLCLLGLESTYGLKFEDFRSLDAGGPLTVAALEDGEIDVALMFSTQGIIADKGWVTLEDDKGLQPAENIVPVIRSEVLTDEIAEVLDGVSAKLTTEEMTELNRRVDVDKEDPETVAAEWLADNGFTE